MRDPDAAFSTLEIGKYDGSIGRSMPEREREKEENVVGTRSNRSWVVGM